ncbi:MAG: type II toxin-antitoxin system prevent-host-death family antitoxin [Anaerolineae bacterium]|jgi:prevent-host-death family protein|nr:type II toxin-antitoxin system prevent-host-death family antitoxin [Anaerolineae bacterium]
MGEMSVGVRELKARLSAYLRQVKGGATLVITEHGKPIGRIVPLRPSVQGRLEELAQAGLLTWSGRGLSARQPVARTSGPRTVADVLLEDRE